MLNYISVSLDTLPPVSGETGPFWILGRFSGVTDITKLKPIPATSTELRSLKMMVQNSGLSKWNPPATGQRKASSWLRVQVPTNKPTIQLWTKTILSNTEFETGGVTTPIFLWSVTVTVSTSGVSTSTLGPVFRLLRLKLARPGPARAWRVVVTVRVVPDLPQQTIWNWGDTSSSLLVDRSRNVNVVPQGMTGLMSQRCPIWTRKNMYRFMVCVVSMVCLVCILCVVPILPVVSILCVILTRCRYARKHYWALRQKRKYLSLVLHSSSVTRFLRAHFY